MAFLMFLLVYMLNLIAPIPLCHSGFVHIISHDIQIFSLSYFSIVLESSW